MRRPILNLAVFVIVLTLTFSFVAVIPAKSQNTEQIIDKLRQLRGKVEGEHPSLANKVNATIHQIEAGAFNGALHKLVNDVNKTVTKWVDNPSELYELIKEIIDLIKGVTPPPPPTPDFEISAADSDLEIERGEEDTTTITVTSLHGFNMPVALTAELDPETDVTFEFNPSTVTPTPEGTDSTLTIKVASTAELGEYEITVTGTSGTKEDSVEIDLTITGVPVEEDTTPPDIVSVLRIPEEPTYNQSVTVKALVTDAESGVNKSRVILGYSGSSWTNVTMTFTEGLFNTNITAFPFNTAVQYRVYASDNAGNWNASKVYSYITTDPYGPLVRIGNPGQGSYLRGKVKITVFFHDDNFERAKLLINETPKALWTSPGEQTFDWDTTNYQDGPYDVKLSVLDKAGNVAEKTIRATVDNTLPSAVIDEPASGSFLRLSVLIKVTASDTNFDRMEVQIDSKRVKMWTNGGSEVLEWNTRKDSDGVHNVSLTVVDKAGNSREVSVIVTVDNTPPVIGTPTWSPEEPGANEMITINVTVSEPTFGSGVQNVTLLFKNKTITEWQSIPMTLKGGNWTVSLANQSDTLFTFVIKAFDKAGNMADSVEQEFKVAAPAGVSLAWILAAIAAIGAGSGGGVYYWRRRRKRLSSALGT